MRSTVRKEGINLPQLGDPTQNPLLPPQLNELLKGPNQSCSYCAKNNLWVGADGSTSPSDPSTSITSLPLTCRATEESRLREQPTDWEMATEASARLGCLHSLCNNAKVDRHLCFQICRSALEVNLPSFSLTLIPCWLIMCLMEHSIWECRHSSHSPEAAEIKS